MVSEVQRELSSSDFEESVESSLSIAVTVDTSTIATETLTRRPTAVPSSRPTISAHPSALPTPLPMPKPTLNPTTAPTTYPTFESTTFSSAGTTAIIIVASFAFVFGIGCFYCWRKHGKRPHTSINARNVSIGACFMIALGTAEIITSWSFTVVVLVQKQWVLGSFTLVSNFLVALARRRYALLAFGTLPGLGDSAELESRGEKALNQIYYMSVLVFECIVLLPWKPTKFLAASTTGFPSKQLLWLSLFLVMAQGISSLAAQVYYLIYDRSTDSEAGSFLLFAIAVGAFTFVWSTITKLWTICRLSRMAAFTPSDAFADGSNTQAKLTPVPMRLNRDDGAPQSRPAPIDESDISNVSLSQFGHWSMYGDIEETKEGGSFESAAVQYEVGTASKFSPQEARTRSSVSVPSSMPPLQSPFLDLNKLLSDNRGDGNSPQAQVVPLPTIRSPLPPDGPRERPALAPPSGPQSFAKAESSEDSQSGSEGGEDSAMQPVAWKEVTLGDSPGSPFTDLEKLRSPHDDIPPPPSLPQQQEAKATSSTARSAPLAPPSGSTRGSDMSMERTQVASHARATTTPIRHLNLGELDLGHFEDTPAGDLLKRLHVGYEEHQQTRSSEN